MSLPRRFPQWPRAFLALGAAASVLSAQAASRAQSSDVEVGPWLGWAAGVELLDHGKDRPASLLNAGFDITSFVTAFGGGYGGPWEVRMGSWAAFNAPTGHGASGEGGITLVLTQAQHASWGTFGLRGGVGYGGDHETHVTMTLWGGVRYVPARAGYGASGLFSKATGIRIVMTARREIDPVEVGALLFGVEFEPDYLLPPYSLFKWGGKH